MPKIRQHVNPLKSDLLTIPGVPRIDPPEQGFLEVELGSAESLFLIERAEQAQAKQALLVGVEIRREMVIRADRLCAEAGQRQVRNVFANMSVDLPKLFAPASVRLFHINFPDPWWKGRQKKRRVITEALADDLASLLEPGGEISIMTDIFDIALEGMAAFETHLGAVFVNVRGPWSFWPENPWGARSRRERQCQQEGQKIWRLRYRRADAASPAAVLASAGDRHL